MVRKKKADNVQQELSLFSPEDFLEKVETALQEAPSPIEQASEEEDVFDRERLLREMKLADDFLNGREMNERYADDYAVSEWHQQKRTIWRTGGAWKGTRLVSVCSPLLLGLCPEFSFNDREVRA